MFSRTRRSRKAMTTCVLPSICRFAQFFKPSRAVGVNVPPCFTGCAVPFGHPESLPRAILIELYMVIFQGKTLVLEYFLHNCAGGYLHNFAVSLCGVSSHRLESTLGRGLSPTSRGFDSRETESAHHNSLVVFLVVSTWSSSSSLFAREGCPRHCATLTGWIRR